MLPILATSPINTQSFDLDCMCISYLNPLYKVTPALPKKEKGVSYYANPLFNGAPGAIRTPDPLVRSQVLYPTELRAPKWLINLF